MPISVRHFFFVLAASCVGPLVIAAIAWPIPIVTDEFAYLLIGETFADGRLANPSPPLFRPFESLHILVEPLYVGKYPPLQSVFLAIGTNFGLPIFGVWLSFSLSALSLYWMLNHWVCSRWAVVGSLIYLTNPIVVLCWGSTFWGGASTFGAACLAIGAAANIVTAKQPLSISTTLFAVSGWLLFLARPYEGGVLFLILLLWTLRKRSLCSELKLSIVAPSGGFLIMAVLVSAHYNRETTGVWWKMPYISHQEQYSNIPLFVFQRSENDNLELGNRQLRQFEEGFARKVYEDSRESLQSIAEVSVSKLFLYFSGFISLGYVFFLIAGLNTKGSDVKLFAAILMIGAISLVLETYGQLHYAAPFLPAVVVLQTLGARRLWRRRQARPIVLIAICASLIQTCVQATSILNDRLASTLSNRPAVEDRISSEPGNHVVIVRYGENHNVHEEWVYNHANIESARIIWVRDCVPEIGEKVKLAFPNRKAWVYFPDINELVSELAD